MVAAAQPRAGVRGATSGKAGLGGGREEGEGVSEGDEGCVRHRAKFSARLRRAKFYERGATELASEFLNCTEKLARFQLVIFYFKVSKSKDFRCSRIGGVQGAGAGLVRGDLYSWGAQCLGDSAATFCCPGLTKTGP